MVKIILKMEGIDMWQFIDSPKNVKILMTKANCKELQRNLMSWSHCVKEMADETVPIPSSLSSTLK